MLSAFVPQAIVELKKQERSKIEALLAYGDRLLVGLSSGDLRIYRVNEDDQHAITNKSGKLEDGNQTSTQDPKPKQKPVDLLREVEKFSKKPVQQLAIIKEASILISLSDGYISFHDLQTFSLSERLEQTKGATVFAVISNVVKDPTTDIVSIVSRLAVAVKRKVLIWSWQDMELSDAPIEIVLAAPVKCLAWSNLTKFVAGMDPGYVMVDIDSQESKDINKPAATAETSGVAANRFGAVSSSGMGYMGMGSWVPKPMASKLAEGQMLLAKDVNTLFIDDNGDAFNKRQVPWAGAPEAVGYSYPYILSLQPQAKGALELRNPETLSLLQTITLPNVTILHVPQPNISLAHAGKGFLVANERCIWRMNALNYASQIASLLEKQFFDEAVSLLRQLEETLIDDKDGRIREIEIQKAESLFKQQQYQEALHLFSVASARPDRVIALYPKIIAGPLSSLDEKTDGEPGESQSLTDQSPRKTTNKRISLKGNQGVPNPALETDAASVKTTTDEGTDTGDKKKGAAAQASVLDGRDLMKAVQELFGFLAQTRVRLQLHINYDGSLKDQTLASRKGTSDGVPPFANLLGSEASNSDATWQQRLLDTAVLVDTTLFRAYMYARPRLAGSLFRLDNFCDPKVVEEKLYENGRYTDLIDFLHGKKLHREALELLEKFGKDQADDEVETALKGPQRIVSYLQQLPFEQIELILQYVRWPLETDPALGMQVFLADMENAESLPRGKVSHFLGGIDPSLKCQYLEHIIGELKDQSSEFHEQLVSIYLDRLKRSKRDESSSDDLKVKLEQFLRNSTEYHKNRVLKEMPADDDRFYEARAIVHSKLSQHAQALQIYVFQMEAPERAEAYCNATYLAATSSKTMDLEAADSIYTTLLALYLAPPAPHAVNIDAALGLLSHHGSRLPALSTLNFLPTTLSVEKLESYFRGRMRAANSRAREEAIVRALAGSEKATADANLFLGEDLYSEGISSERGRNRRIVLSEDRMCTVCHKRFGRAAVRVWPSGEIRHYGCGEPRDVGSGSLVSSQRRLGGVTG